MLYHRRDGLNVRVHDGARVEKTVVAPYSLCAIDGARVSAPLKCDDVRKNLLPKNFNLRTMPNRLAKVADLFARILGNASNYRN